MKIDTHAFPIGQYKICKLQDGIVPMDTSIFPDSDSEEGKRLRIKNGFEENGAAMSPANAFLLTHANGNHLLVDAGCGSQFGDTFGNAPRLLTTMGISHDKITAVCLTHLHPDHLGGVVDDDLGHARFKNAYLYISEQELEFWQNPESKEKFPRLVENGSFDQVQKLLAPYLEQGRVKSVKTDIEVLEGISFKLLPGHTPGHCGIIINSAGQKAMIWGDIVHSEAYQFVHPEWSVAFDMDKAKALETRLKTMEQLLLEDTCVFGPHVFGSGYLRKNQDNEYCFVSRETK